MAALVAKINITVRVYYWFDWFCSPVLCEQRSRCSGFRHHFDDR